MHFKRAKLIWCLVKYIKIDTDYCSLPMYQIQCNLIKPLETPLLKRGIKIEVCTLILNILCVHWFLYHHPHSRPFQMVRTSSL